MATDLIDYDDAIALAEKVIEMADRVKVMHSACPGARAASGFTVDGTRFKITVSVDDEQQEQST